MKPQATRVRIPLAAAIVGTIAMLGTARAQSNPYHLVENWAQLPAGRTFGAVIAVDVDRQGNVWAFERCGGDTCAASNVAPILKFDPSGKLVNSFGAGMFVFPHGFYVDRDGSLWATDGQGKDGKGQQVFKFSPDGKVLLTLGKAGVAGNGPDTFNAPSGVVVAPNGDIFVADGHGEDTNARIVRFSRDGKFIKAWGRKGTGPGEFGGLHAIAMDSTGRVFVGAARIAESRSSIRTVSSWRTGNNSAVPAAFSLMLTTRSMSPIRSRMKSRTRALRRAFASAVLKTGSSKRTFRFQDRRRNSRPRSKASRPMPGAICTGQKRTPIICGNTRDRKSSGMPVTPRH